MAGSFAVEARGIGYQYGNHVALSDLNLALKAGEIVGLLGANGAGKTTTLKLLCGLLQPTAGTLSVLGHPVSNALPRVGVVAENPVGILFPYANMMLEGVGGVKMWLPGLEPAGVVCCCLGDRDAWGSRVLS